MKQLLIFGFVFFLGGWLSAQNDMPLINWSEENKIDRKDKAIVLAGSGSNYVFTLRDLIGTGEIFVIERYDKNTLEKQYSKEVSLPKLAEGPIFFKDLIFMEDKLLLLTTQYDKEKRSYKAYATWMDMECNKLDFPILLDEIAGERRLAPDPFEFRLSPDSSKIMIFHDSPFLRKGNELFSFKVYNTDFEPLWQKDLELPYKKEIFEINDYILTNNGDIFMMSGIMPEKRDKEFINQGLRDKKYIIISYEYEKNKVKEFEVNLGDKWIMSITFGMTPDNNLAIGGFYSNDRYFSVAGTFFFKLDGESRQVESKGLMAFDKDFMIQFMNEKKAVSGRELDNFYFDHFYLREDGGATMVAERFYVLKRTTSDITNGTTQITTYFHYEDLIVIDVNPNGTINWARKVPKKQISTNDQGQHSSYAISFKDRDVNLVFNDNPNNVEALNEDLNARLSTFNSIKSGVVTWVSVDAEGNQKRKILFETKEDNTIVKPKIFISTEEGELILYAHHRKYYQVGRVRF